MARACVEAPRRRAWALLLTATASASALLIGVPARAQQQGAAIQEVIVTARKREETLLKVPVVAQVISGEQLTRLNNTWDVQNLVPSLRIGEAQLSNGTRVFLRGVGTTSGDPGVDQSVSLNVDGLQLTNGLAFKGGLFDLGRIEVLKGPQGLFYGKNSPGGVISLYSADPTDKVEVIAAARYEVEAHTKQADMIISGPVADTLKLRLAARYNDTDGYFKNAATALPGTGGVTPTDRRFPQNKGWIVRGTAIWTPTSEFDVRVKGNYIHDRDRWSGILQVTSCPDGVGAVPLRLSNGQPAPPYLGGGEDCKLNRTARYVGFDPAAFPGNPAIGFSPPPNGGVPYRDSTQYYGTVEMNYRPIKDVTLTSLTGYYHLNTISDINTANSTFAGPTAITGQHVTRRDFTEELRATSDFDGPANFTVGAFYQDAWLHNTSKQWGNILQGFPPVRGFGLHAVTIQTYSVFGQLRYMLTPQVELDVGARWSDETRKDKPESLLTGTPVPTPIAVPRIHTNNVKPEVTMTYRPEDTLTLFASYRTGYKSGSLNISTSAAPGQNNAYNDEDVKGGEVGVKSRLLNRTLAIDLAAYDYHYTGLQVTTVIPGPGLIAVARTLNAGRARSYGVELDTAYNPPEIEGLRLRASINWNEAKFQDLQNVPCWGGQTVADGCNQAQSASARDPVTGQLLYTAQNLSGIPLLNAPKWAGSFGFEYSRPVGGDMTVTISNNNYFSGSYLTALGNRADFFQGSWIKADLGVALKGPRDRWEVSVSGKNIFDKLTAATCSSANLQGGLLLGGQVTGGTSRGAAGVDELVCFVDPGREVWLTVTFRPFN
jgi:iron complex outermembrane receptor protein